MTEMVGTYVVGAFSCYLCRKTYNYQLKTEKSDFINLHTNTHIARFFNDIFGRQEVRNAFYNYNKRIVEMARLQNMSETM